jgi:hypothetical protein
MGRLESAISVPRDFIRKSAEATVRMAKIALKSRPVTYASLIHIVGNG